MGLPKSLARRPMMVKSCSFKVYGLSDDVRIAAEAALHNPWPMTTIGCVFGVRSFPAEKYADRRFHAERFEVVPETTAPHTRSGLAPRPKLSA